MTVKEKILEEVNKQPGISVGELAKKLKKIYQHIRNETIELEKKGLVERRKEDKVRIYPAEATGTEGNPSKTQGANVNEDSEDEVKKKLVAHLEGSGWKVQAQYGNASGADIVARKLWKTWIIEVKGAGSRRQMFDNYFRHALGTILMRMESMGPKYSVAFPDNPIYRKLWAKLPHAVKKRLGLSALFVGEHVEERL